jgi:hypothetical protein
MNTFHLAMRNLPTYRTPPQLLDFLEQLFAGWRWLYCYKVIRYGEKIVPIA